MRLAITTPPTSLPVSIDEAKYQLGLAAANTYHDEHLLRYIKAATERAQQLSGRQILTATLTLTLDDFPDHEDTPIYLPRPPLQAVSSITYTNSSGTAGQTLSTDVYKVLTSAEPGEIHLKYGQSWPSVYEEPGVIAIAYTAGYGDDADDLEASEEWIRDGILLAVQASFMRGPDSERYRNLADEIFSRYYVGDDFVDYELVL